ncbi:unnamed protein product, partial [Oncorhynchus mykiss]
RPGRPSKLSAHTRRRLIRDAAKRPMITLDELHRSTAEVGDSVHRTTISRILHKSALYGRVARRKPFLKDIHKKCRLKFATSHLGDTPNMCSGQMKPKLNFLVTMQNVMFGVNCYICVQKNKSDSRVCTIAVGSRGAENAAAPPVKSHGLQVCDFLTSVSSLQSLSLSSLTTSAFFSGFQYVLWCSKPGLAHPQSHYITKEYLTGL